MTRAMQGRNPDRRTRLAVRALATCAGAAATLCGARAGADGGREEWFGSPVSGTTYRVERDAATHEKHLVAPDGRRFSSAAAVIEAETKALAPLQRLLAPDLLALSAEPARGDDLVDVTLIFRRQPLH